MADRQIYQGAVEPVPDDYEVNDAVRFILKAVTATFDGSGAAGAYLPCVTLVSDSGHVIARAVDPAVTVAAGVSAEVSWFPGVKHATSSAPPSGATPTWGIVSEAADLPVLAAGATLTAVPYDLTDGSDTFFMTSDTANFSLDSVNHAMAVANAGYYLIASWTRAREAGAANAGNFALRVDSSSQQTPIASAMTSFLGGHWSAPGQVFGAQTFWDPNSLEFADSKLGGDKWKHVLTNRVGVNLTLQRATFCMVRIGDSKTGIIP